MICEKCKIDSKHYATIKQALVDVITAIECGIQRQDKDGKVFTQQFGIVFLENLKKAQAKGVKNLD